MSSLLKSHYFFIFSGQISYVELNHFKLKYTGIKKGRFIQPTFSNNLRYSSRN